MRLPKSQGIVEHLRNKPNVARPRWAMRADSSQPLICAAGSIRPVGHAHRVAVATALRDDAATAHRIPRCLSPFDFCFRSHRAFYADADGTAARFARAAPWAVGVVSDSAGSANESFVCL